jgi:N6-L-threonylcarbamoyladenine synthase
MNILSIETSCDETGIAIISVTESDATYVTNVLSNELISQAELHAQYGGVFPSLAKQEHAKALTPLLRLALQHASMFTTKNFSDPLPTEKLETLLAREPELHTELLQLLSGIEKPPIDAVAVTHGPGLEPALWVGINCAKALSIVWNIPIVPINHMEGHMYAALATALSPREYHIPKHITPAVALLISGGHTEFVSFTTLGAYTVIGKTRDDAAGECFDKCARLLGLSYPGGPEIARLAREAREEQLPQLYTLPRPMMTEHTCDLSFSGLKTAVLRLTQTLTQIDPLSETDKKIIAREIEDAIADVLVSKTKRALFETNAHTFIVSGGVSANTTIVNRLRTLIDTEFGYVQLLVSPRTLATDNALMIAFAAIPLALTGQFTQIADIQAHGNLAYS